MQNVTINKQCMSHYGEKVYCKQTLRWTTGPKWMFFKKKVENNRIFSYIFSIIVLFLYWKFYSPIGSFCYPIQKIRSFAPIFLLLPVRGIIVHLENLT